MWHIRNDKDLKGAIRCLARPQSQPVKVIAISEDDKYTVAMAKKYR